jgi:hypothetical protein
MPMCFSGEELIGRPRGGGLTTVTLDEAGNRTQRVDQQARTTTSTTTSRAADRSHLSRPEHDELRLDAFGDGEQRVTSRGLAHRSPI